MKANSIRRASQRMRPRLIRCEGCGATDSLQRHHPNREDEPALVVVLCQPCHTVADMDLGLWGRGPKKAKTCTICGEQFTNYSHSRVKTCSRRCLSEAGRRNAAKRWHRGSSSPASPASPTASPSASTDLEASATPSSPKSPNGLAGGSSTTKTDE